MFVKQKFLLTKVKHFCFKFNYFIYSLSVKNVVKNVGKNISNGNCYLFSKYLCLQVSAILLAFWIFKRNYLEQKITLRKCNSYKNN